MAISVFEQLREERYELEKKLDAAALEASRRYAREHRMSYPMHTEITSDSKLVGNKSVWDSID